MEILAAIDGSDNSMRALSFAADLTDLNDGRLHAVHISDERTDATDAVFDRADEVLTENETDAEFELREAETLSVRTAHEAGKELLAYAAEHGIDHIVVGHHGAGRVERAMLGSASETIVRGTTVPVTVVP